VKANLPRMITIVRCYCQQCGYAMSAMTIGALIDAQREHERYVRQDDIPVTLPQP